MTGRNDTTIPCKIETKKMLMDFIFYKQNEVKHNVTYDDAIRELLKVSGWGKTR